MVCVIRPDRIFNGPAGERGTALPKRRYDKHTVLGRVVLVAMCIGAIGAADAPTTRPTSVPVAPGAIADATLHDVSFVDSERGWAVGALGTVLSTADGGRSWKRQAVPSAFTYHAVHFVNEASGWIVGGAPVPYTRLSRGILLCTHDGGKHWFEPSTRRFPRLRDVRFSDTGHGIVVGEPTLECPSGVWITRTGGRQWKPVRGEAGAEPGACALAEADFGLVIGTKGYAASLRSGRLQQARLDPISATLYDVSMPPGRVGYAVGTGGTVLRTETAGSIWGPVSLGVGEAESAVDLYGVCFVDGWHGWAVGSPGSVVWHTRNAGRDWQRLRTGRTAPLRAVHFIDRKTGWAVGDLGTVLGTRDGGNNWEVLRSGGSRCPLLGLWTGPDGVPARLLTEYAGDKGFLTAVVCFQRTADQVSEGQLADAAGFCGATSLVRLPAPPIRTARAPDAEKNPSWQDERLSDALLQRLVLLVRTYRPDVVVAGSPRDRASDSARLARLLGEAFNRAADPNAFPEHGSLLHLEPWTVRKLYVPVPPDVQANPKATIAYVQTVPVGTRWARWLPGVSQLAAATMGRPPFSSERPSRWKLAATRVGEFTHERHLFRGLIIAPGADGRRAWDMGTDEALAHARDRAGRWFGYDRKLDMLVRHSGWAGAVLHTNLMLEKHADDNVSHGVMYGLACRLAEHGQWLMAEQMMRRVMTEHPGRLEAAQACRWLLWHYSSVEAFHALASRYGTSAGRTRLWLPEPKAEKPRDPRRPKAEKPPKTEDLPQPRLERDTVPLVSPKAMKEMRDRWYREGAAMAEKLRGLSPVLWESPRTQFMLASLHRHLNDPVAARRIYRDVMDRDRSGLWGRNANMEVVGISPGTVPKKAVWLMPQVTQQLMVDGDGGDRVWTALQGHAKSLTTADGEPPGALRTTVRACYDTRVLYLLVHCRGPVPKQRDIPGADHVQILIDVDRDYASHFLLAVDSRGRRSGTCLDDRAWHRAWERNWKAVVKPVDDGWMAEIAVPLDTLGWWPGGVPKPGTMWCFNVVRSPADGAVQAWSHPAGVRPRPEGSGLLTFTVRKRRPTDPEGQPHGRTPR